MSQDRIESRKSINSTERAQFLAKLSGEMRRKQAGEGNTYMSAVNSKKQLKRRSPLLFALCNMFEKDDPKDAMEYFKLNFIELERSVNRDEEQGKDTFAKRERIMRLFIDCARFKYGDTQKNINVNVDSSIKVIEARLVEAGIIVKGDVKDETTQT